MPFKSKSQLRTCYSKNDRRWDCDKWLKETPSICNLPERERKGMDVKSRSKRRGEIIKGPIKIGARGGRYFELYEKSKSGKGCIIKVYLKK